MYWLKMRMGEKRRKLIRLDVIERKKWKIYLNKKNEANKLEQRKRWEEESKILVRSKIIWELSFLVKQEVAADL
jgi:hypothetical protein